MKVNGKRDLILVASFVSTLFYAATYPYIHKEVMTHISDNLIALSQIVNCGMIVIFGTLWNKYSDKLYRIFPLMCIMEIICITTTTVLMQLWCNFTAYYIADTLTIALITRNIMCGRTKMYSIRYIKENREKFDNTDNSVCAIATILGSIVAMILELDIISMLWIATIGNMSDNIIYIYVYLTTKKAK